jgi:hypothetical protein
LFITFSADHLELAGVTPEPLSAFWFHIAPMLNPV